MTIFRKSCINRCSATFLRSRAVAMVDAGRTEGLRFHKAVRDPKYAPTPSALLQLNEVIAIKCPGRGLMGASARHSAHPLEMTFQRSPLPLKRVTDNGLISMRQNDWGDASMTWTIAARIIVEWVTVMDRWPRACSSASQVATRRMRPRMASPPCGAAAGSCSHELAASGS